MIGRWVDSWLDAVRVHAEEERRCRRWYFIIRDERSGETRGCHVEVLSGDAPDGEIVMARLLGREIGVVKGYCPDVGGVRIETSNGGQLVIPISQKGPMQPWGEAGTRVSIERRA